VSSNTTRFVCSWRHIVHHLKIPGSHWDIPICFLYGFRVMDMKNQEWMQQNRTIGILKPYATQT